MLPFGVIILAAGASRRLGRPKQLLPYRGSTLVRHAAQTALDSGASEAIVVVGAMAAEVARALDGLPVIVIENSDWETGMGSSIAVGVRAVSAEIDAVIVMPADQPAVPAEHLRALAQRREESGAPFVATEFARVIGAPVAFARSMFDDLTQLSGEQGARALLARGGAHPPSIQCDAALLDVDTEEDVARMGS